MYKCFVLIVIFAMVYTSLASLSIAINTKHKDYPNQCYVESEKTAYDFGVHHPEGKCNEIECYKDYSIEMRNCGAISAPEGYHNEVDYTKPYPDCCVNFVEDKKE